MTIVAIVMGDEAVTATIGETGMESASTIGWTGIRTDGTVTTTITIGVDIETEKGKADAETLCYIYILYASAARYLLRRDPCSQLWWY